MVGGEQEEDEHAADKDYIVAAEEVREEQGGNTGSSVDEFTAMLVCEVKIWQEDVG